MTISVILLTSNVNGANAGSYATASISPTSGRTVIVAVKYAAVASGNTGSVTGLSGTWNRIGSQHNAGMNNAYVEAFSCTDYTGTGALTLLPGDPATHALWSVVEVDGLDTTTPVVAGSFVGTTSAAEASTTITLNAAAKSNNRPIAFFANDNNVTGQCAPRANWAELSEVAQNSPASMLEAQWRSDAFETTASATYTGGSYATNCVAFELNDVSAGEDPNADPQTANVTTVANSVASKVNSTSDSGAVTTVANAVVPQLGSGTGVSSLTATANNSGVDTTTGSSDGAISVVSNNPELAVLLTSEFSPVTVAAQNATVETTSSGTDVDAELISLLSEVQQSSIAILVSADYP